MIRMIAFILRQILSCVFISYSLSCFSQEFINKIPLNKETNYAVETQLSYQIFDEKNKLLQLFLIDDFQISGVLLNDSFDANKTIVINEKRNVFKNFSGGSIRENNTYLYFTGKSDDNITIVSLNFDSGTHSLSSIKLDMKGEMSLNVFEIKEGMLLLTIVKGTSKLKLYKIVGNALTDVITFDFTDKEKYFGDTPTLHKCLVKGFIKKLPDFKIISSKNPNPLELTASHVKIYFENEQIYFTIDVDDTKTIVIRLDHANKQKEFLTFMKSLMNCNHQPYYRAGNSLIFEGKLCQVFACSEQIGFRFIDMNTGKVLKEYFTENKKQSYLFNLF